MKVNNTQCSEAENDITLVLTVRINRAQFYLTATTGVEPAFTVVNVTSPMHILLEMRQSFHHAPTALHNKVHMLTNNRRQFVKIVQERK